MICLLILLYSTYAPSLWSEFIQFYSLNELTLREIQNSLESYSIVYRSLILHFYSLILEAITQPLQNHLVWLQRSISMGLKIIT